MPESRDRPALAALIAANLVPLALVLAGAWDTAGVLLAYWTENLVVGAYAIARILSAGASGWGDRIGGAGFFTLHYGLFCFGHGAILVELFDLAAVPEYLWLVVAALVVSHGVSFVRHWVLGAERQGAESDREMARPYGRIVLMHLVVLGGAFCVEWLGQPIGALAILVVLKTAADLALHRRSHAAQRPSATVGEATPKREP